MCVYLILFFYFSVDGHLVYFPLLVIESNAALNTDLKYLFESLLSVPLGIYLSVELLDKMMTFSLMEKSEF